MNNIDWNFVHKIIKKQIDKFDRKFTINELEKKMLEKKQAAMKVIINNKIVKVIRMDDQFKNNRKNHLENFLKQVALKYPAINTTIYCNVYDWGCKDDKDYPFFTMSSYRGSKNFIIPDYLFLRDYNKCSGRNNDQISMNKLIEKYHDYKKKFEDKNNKCFFRAGTAKNKTIIEMFNNHNFVDAKWSKDCFLTYDEMFSYRYVISHYMRWDSVYMFLRSNLFVFMYDGWDQYLWYDLFLNKNEHYFSFKTLKEFEENLEKIKNNEILYKKIIKKRNEITDNYFNIDFAIDYMGKLLLEYQKLIN